MSVDRLLGYHSTDQLSSTETVHEASLAYAAEPRELEQRLARVVSLQHLPLGNFSKQNRNGKLRLELSGQEDNIELPEYSQGARIQGTLHVNMEKENGIASVSIKVIGGMHFESGDGGRETVKLSLAKAELWKKDSSGTCPGSLAFQLDLPKTFMFGNEELHLPPTYVVKLADMYGLSATVEYSIIATVVKESVAALVRNKVPSLHVGEISVSLPFLYYPRSRPAAPNPPPIDIIDNALPQATHGWTPWMINVPFKIIPKSLRGAPDPLPLVIPPEQVLAAYTPYAPPISPSAAKSRTRIQLLRQSTIDVNQSFTPSKAKSHTRRVDLLGQGIFKSTRTVRGAIVYFGEIKPTETIRVSSFRVASLSVQDYIFFTIQAPEKKRSPFGEVSKIIPIKLTTEAWDRNIVI